MTIHVNIGEAKTRLSELVAAAVRGEEVVVSKAGEPQVQLVAVAEKAQVKKAQIVARRLATLGIWKGLLAEDESIVPSSMTDKEIEERWDRKFGPTA